MQSLDYIDCIYACTYIHIGAYSVNIYICHSTEGDWALPIPYLLASVGMDKVQWSLLSGTLVFVADHINLVVTQAKKVDKN